MVASIAAAVSSAQTALTAAQPTKKINTSRNAGGLKSCSRRSRSPAVTTANHESTSTSPTSFDTDRTPSASAGRIESRKVRNANRQMPAVRFAIAMTRNTRPRVTPSASVGSTPASTPINRAEPSSPAPSNLVGSSVRAVTGKGQPSLRTVGRSDSGMTSQSASAARWRCVAR